MKFTSSHLFIAALLLSVGVFFLWIFQPSYREIRDLRAEISDGQRRKLEEREVSRVLTEKSQELKTLRRDVDRLESSLLRQNEYSPLMNALRSLSSRLGFLNESISLKGQESREHFVAAVLDLKLTGDFEKIYRFIQGLEELPVTVQIDTLSLRGEPRGGGGGIQARIALSAPLAGL